MIKVYTLFDSFNAYELRSGNMPVLCLKIQRQSSPLTAPYLYNRTATEATGHVTTSSVAICHQRWLNNHTDKISACSLSHTIWDFYPNALTILLKWNINYALNKPYKNLHISILPNLLCYCVLFFFFFFFFGGGGEKLMKFMPPFLTQLPKKSIYNVLYEEIS